MGRQTPSTTTLSPSQRRDARAKRAKVTLTKDIPALLVAYPRAKRGVEGSVLIVEPPISKRSEVKQRNGEESGDSMWQGKGAKSVEVGESNEEKRVGKRKSGKKPRGGKGGGETATSTLDSTVLPISRLTLRSDSDGDRAKPTKNSTSTKTTPPISASTDLHPKPHIRIQITDTLTAAHHLQQNLTTHPSQSPRIVLLNMCSPLRPGGGFLSGATSQEESLCMRTTLYPSLREEFYRLPEVGGVYTRDVLVFREIDESGSGVRDMEKGARWWVDVISAGMLRFPEVEGVAVPVLDEGGSDGDGSEGEGETEKVIGRYASPEDRELVEEKMRAVMRIVKGQGKGVKGIILGAWGCGAYGNPVSEVAGCWRRVLCGDDGELNVGGTSKSRKGRSGKSAKETEDLARERESWSDMEIVFAIKEKKMAVEFARWFGGNVEVENADGGDVDEEESIEGGSDASVSELNGKIAELEIQIAGSRSEVQKEMLRRMLVTLKESQRDEGGVQLD